VIKNQPKCNLRLKGFIFDLDGVLTDTSELHYLSWKRLAEREGISFTREDNEKLRGVSRLQSLTLLLKGKKVSEDKTLEMMHFKNELFKDLIQNLSPKDLLPGAKELIDEIRQSGFKIGIASASKNAKEVINRLNINDKIDTISDGYSVKKQKPAPDIFLHTAKTLNIDPSQCVVVEDAAAGIEAAIVAGMCTIGIGPVKRVGLADVVLSGLKNITLKQILNMLNDDITKRSSGFGFAPLRSAKPNR